MASPNIVGVTDIRGFVAYVIPSSAATATTSWTYDGTTSLTGLTPSAGTIVNRVTSITAANTTASAATATIALGNNATFASATVTTYPAYQISVPANSTLIIIDKTNSLYVTNTTSVAAFSGTASALTFTATFEAITGTA
jgi:hypothetical protein